ncbi:MAG: hypothetical protein CVV64_02355 [Candidatus Wallbacteria bacterium HGW-Wallbacteria-1]|jgi:glycosyltransferase involved in cell wall biosynthesis|uniref:Uncharacterized protein n=1 Tax=Candidatus Wallbacteria bacterium HGW-Wallbacteria-1 TaxID=2013854 RepID=A0A2N1PVC5_9BACT|nr:MAG: hypothetical protein CVV64_02355 [Candidatus Wallbacteria bacterium HGW-Wallbacteria-1]
MKGQIIYFFSPVFWNSLFQRHQQLMVRMARENTVIFIEPFTALPEAAVRRNPVRPLRRINRGLVVMSSLVMVRSTDYPVVGKWHLEALVSRARRVAGELNPGGREILWLARHDCSEVRKYLNAALVCYDCADEHWAFSVADRNDTFDGPGRRGKVIALEEMNTLRQADLVFAVSETLARRIRLVNPSVHVVGNGADKSIFDYRRVKSARMNCGIRGGIGFTGAVFEWVDLDLLAEAAEEYPSYPFLIAGPVRQSLERRGMPPNICFTGPIPYSRLPEFLGSLDLALVPFRVNHLTRASDPIKVYEYLSMGLPVISTPIYSGNSGTMPVTIGKNREHFIYSIASLLEKGSGEEEALMMDERRGWVADWDQRFRQIESIIAEALS